MIIHNEHPQRSLEWLILKNGKIGGTLCKGLFIKSDTLMIDMISQLTEDYEPEDSYISFDMQRGIELEPIAREALSNEVFVSFNEVGFLQSASIPILGISPDGISEDGTIQCEIKCPAAKKHTATLIANDIPSDNIHQCLHAFVVNPKLEKLYFASYRPESKIKALWYKCLTIDSEIDLGTKAKPNIKTIAEWVKIARIEAEALNQLINETLNALNETYK